MAFKNHISIVGRFTKEPELRKTQSGLAVCSFSLAVERPHTTKDNRATDFFECSAWRQTAEMIAKYFHKGDPVGVEGYMRQESYTDKEGRTVKTWKLEVENFDFLPARKGDAPAETAPAEPAQPEVNMTANADEELPF